jgi:hypothetical protein
MQTFRSSPLQNIVVGWVAPLGFGIVALASFTSAGPGRAYGVAEGIMLAVMAVGLFINQVRSRLVVNDHGLTYGSLFGTKSIAWTDVHDVEVGAGYSFGGWYSPVVITSSGRARINSILGTQAHVGRVVDAIRSARPAGS